MTEIDYSFFEDNGFGDNTRIVEMLRNQNRRVRQIFNNDDTDMDRDLFANRNSHGILLESILDEEPLHDILPASNKENTPASLRALSPKSIHEAEPEEITEPPRPLVKIPRNDLRRSLFRASVNGSRRLSEITSSTPVPAHRGSTNRESFFVDNVNLSPIKSCRVVLERVQSEVPKEEPVAKSPIHITRVESLAPIENELREQYNIDNEPRTPAKKSQSMNEPPSVKKSLKAKRSNLSQHKTQMSIEPMEISEEFVKTYQQSRLRKLCVSRTNMTDMRTMEINETENVQRLTPDREPPRQLLAIEEHEDEDEIERDLRAITEGNAPTTSNKSFAKPSTPQNTQTDNMSLASNNSSIVKVVPQNVRESMRALRKSVGARNETEQTITEQPSMSCRVTVSKKRKPPKQPSETAVEYLKLTSKRKKSKDDQSRKRTLYTQQYSDDEDTSPRSSIATKASSEGSPNTSQKVVEAHEKSQRSTRSSTAANEALDKSQRSTRSSSAVVREEEPPAKRTRQSTRDISVHEEEDDQQVPELATEIAVESTKKSKKVPRAARSVSRSSYSPPSVKKPSKAKPLKKSSKPQKSKDLNRSDSDVIYVPDNDRYALRTRRMVRPNWTSTAPSNMRITYGIMTNQEIQAELKVQKIVKRSNIPITKALKVMNASNAFKPPMSEILKVMEKLEKEKKKLKKIVQSTKSKSSARVDSEYESVMSEQSNARSLAPSEAIYQAFNDMTKNNGDTRVIECTPTYDIAQFDCIDWVSCSDGVEYYGFLGQQGDGLIKLLPGAVKKRAKTKNSVLKFLILCGEVTFIIGEAEKTIKNFGYVSIRQGQRYEMQNRCEKEAIINFMRLNPSDLDR